MTRYEITDYSASWFYEEHRGRFVFYWKDENNPDAGPDIRNSNWLMGGISISNPAEFQVMLDMLRNESPIFFDTRSKQLIARLEPVGEGEGDTE